LPTNKKLGQHLLKNPGIVNKIVEAADIKPSDLVFEIGPGTGNLTMKVLPLAKRVVVQEIDPRMAAEVRKRAITEGRMNLDVSEGDVLRAEWPPFDVCTANLPYQISSPFTFRLLSHRPLFRCAVLMFQKEFAERLIAECGSKNYGRLALNTRLFVKVSCVCKVSRGSFNPPPEVDSMVVKIVPRDPPIQVDFREWDGLMRICFLRKNKILQATFGMSSTLRTLEENYRTWCALKGTEPVASGAPFKEHVLGVLRRVGVAEQRGIRIELDTYFQLLLEFNRAGIHFSNQTTRATPGEDMVPDGELFEDDGDGDMDE
jgi:18S rRNA (adenine1779-N6/adenine1780-N6)-dimethyltransferase